MNFIQKLEPKWAEGKHVCVGLDTDYDKIPSHIRQEYSRRPAWEAVFQFNSNIIETTHDLVAAYKPNSAFYEAVNLYDGMRALEKTIQLGHSFNALVIDDAKRADIGKTNQKYVRAILDPEGLGTDAITVNPYFGGWPDGIGPFLEQKDKGIIVLCRTSNKSAGEFQDLPVLFRGVWLKELLGEDPEKYAHELGWERITTDFVVPLYQLVALKVDRTWNTNSNCLLVVGATYPSELEKIRRLAPNIPLLIPGIGTQGGDLEATVEAAKHRFIINSSSAIIYASNGQDFDCAARDEVVKLDEKIDAVLRKAVI